MRILLRFSTDCKRKEKTFLLFQEGDSEPHGHTASPNTGSGATTTRDVGKCPGARGELEDANPNAPALLEVLGHTSAVLPTVQPQLKSC